MLFVCLVCTVLLASGFTWSPQSGADPTPAPGGDPHPELHLSVQDSRGFSGAPVLLTARLMNADAMEAVRAAALLVEADTLDRDLQSPAERSQGRLQDEEDADVHTLGLSGDWREHVTFELEDEAGEVAPLDPVLLSSTGHTSTEIGVLPLITTWAVPPDVTRSMATGQYTVTARLDTAELFTDRDLGEDTVIEDSAGFSLMLPMNEAERALIEEINALFYVGLLDCQLAVPHAVEAMRLDPERIKAYWYAAQCEAVLGNTERAIVLLEDLLARTPPMKDGGDFYIEARLWLEQLKAGGQ
jgi:hypothetical protein